MSMTEPQKRDTLLITIQSMNAYSHHSVCTIQSTIRTVSSTVSSTLRTTFTSTRSLCPCTSPPPQPTTTTPTPPPSKMDRQISTNDRPNLDRKLPNSVVHALKLALNGKGDVDILKTDRRMRATDDILQELQRTFPKLQAAVEENDKLWASLGHNVMTTAEAIKSMSSSNAPNNRISVTLDALRSAGEHVFKSRSLHPLNDDCKRCHHELRTFNDALRDLQSLYTACVTSLKSREYYVQKVDIIIHNERQSRHKVSDREIAKRIRNELKLNQVVRDADVMSERLQRELEQTLVRKDDIIQLVLTTFLRIQDAHFSRDIMAPVMGAFRQTGDLFSQRRTRDTLDYSRLTHTDTDFNVSWADGSFVESPILARPIPITMRIPHAKPLQDLTRTHRNIPTHDADLPIVQASPSHPTKHSAKHSGSTTDTPPANSHPRTQTPAQSAQNSQHMHTGPDERLANKFSRGGSGDGLLTASRRSSGCVDGEEEEVEEKARHDDDEIEPVYNHADGRRFVRQTVGLEARFPSGRVSSSAFVNQDGDTDRHGDDILMQVDQAAAAANAALVEMEVMRDLGAGFPSRAHTGSRISRHQSAAFQNQRADSGSSSRRRATETKGLYPRPC